jgi:hypothetical protein
MLQNYRSMLSVCRCDDPSDDNCVTEPEHPNDRDYRCSLLLSGIVRIFIISGAACESRLDVSREILSDGKIESVFKGLSVKKKVRYRTAYGNKKIEMVSCFMASGNWGLVLHPGQ